jgi:hypothetical protein
MSIPRRSPRFIHSSIQKLQDEVAILEEKKRMLDSLIRQTREPVNPFDIQPLIDFQRGKISSCPIDLEGYFQLLDLSAADDGQFGGHPKIFTWHFDKKSRDGLRFLRLTSEEIAEYDTWNWYTIGRYKRLYAKKTIRSHGYDLTTEFTLSIPI